MDTSLARVRASLLDAESRADAVAAIRSAQAILSRDTSDAASVLIPLLVDDLPRRWGNDLVHEVVGTVLVSAPAAEVFQALSSLLFPGNPAAPVVADVFANYFSVPALLADLASRLSDDAQVTAHPLADDLLSQMASLPDRLANALLASPPPSLRPGAWTRSVISTAHGDLADGLSRGDARLPAIYAAASVRVLRRSACWRDAAVAVVAALSSGDSGVLTAIKAVLAGLGDGRAMQQLVLALLDALLHQLDTYDAVVEVVLPVACDTSAFPHAVAALLLHRTLADPLVHAMIAVLAALPDPAVVVQHVYLPLLRVWSSHAFIARAAVPQQRRVTLALLLLLRRVVTADVLNNDAHLVQTLLNGVHHRLAAVTEPRVFGMLVAEAMSRLLEPDEPLVFEEKPPLPPVLEIVLDPPPTMPRLALSAALDVPQTPGDIGRRRIRQRSVQQRQQEVQPQQGGTPSAAADPADVDAFVEDEFPRYSLQDDLADLDAHKHPVYLRDTYATLRDKEASRDAVAAALAAIPALVERAGMASQLVLDVGQPMAALLLHMENKYALDDYVALRQAAITSLAVHGTSVVVPYLTTQFYEANYSLSHRFDILAVLAGAAQVLSEYQKQQRQHTPDDRADGSVTRASTLTASVEAKSRRWGTAKTARAARLTQAQQPYGNSFIAVSGMFFFPLMARYDSAGNTYDLLGEDAMLLARLMHTLAVIITCAGAGDPDVLSKARAMCGVVFALRWHTEAVVRRAVLHAMLAVASGLSASLWHELPAELAELRDWLTEVLDSAEDDDVQRVARALYAVLARTHADA